MRISYLKEFCVLASLLNFTKAAEQLYITQPALSRHISALEQEYGVVLIKRTTKSVELTDAGRKLLKDITPVLVQYDKAIATLQQSSLSEPLSLNIGIPHISINNYLGSVPEIFRKEHPGVDLNFYPESPERNVTRLLSGNLDIIMISNIPFPGSNQLVFYDYSVDPVIVLSKDRLPIANKETVTLYDLKDYTFLCKNSGYYSVLWEKIALQCKWSGFEPSVRYYNTLEECLVAARQGFGVIILTTHHKSLASAGLSYMTLDETSCITRSSLAYLKTNVNPLIPDFIDIFSKHGYYLAEQEKNIRTFD